MTIKFGWGVAKFETEAYGKCIIAGEHAVLRNCKALVTPVKDQVLKSSWELGSSPLELEFSGDHGRELSLVFGGVLDQACRKLSLRREKLLGNWLLENNIRLGGGLGASAAICVTIARYFVSTGNISEKEVYTFAQSLEDLFHGESSGVDIAASMSQGPLLFSRQGDQKSVNINWSPHLYLTYSGHKGVTIECVEQVKKMINENPGKGNEVDMKMAQAVELSVQALAKNEAEGMPLFKDALNMATSCFEDWGLIDMQMRQEMHTLKSLGAIAVKPTGSGMGGFLLSLWKQRPTSYEKFIQVKI